MATTRRTKTARPTRREATADEFKAMAHPLRLRILRLCLHEAMTNKQIADRLDADPATTLHHVRTLVRTGFLDVEGVRSGARGALEKPYRATGKSWVLSVSRAEDRSLSKLAVVDALRAELAETDPRRCVGLRPPGGQADRGHHGRAPGPHRATGARSEQPGR